MNKQIILKHCDSCAKRFRRTGDAFVMGVQPHGKDEVIFHLCHACVLAMADGDACAQRISDRAMATASNRHMEVLVA